MPKKLEDILKIRNVLADSAELHIYGDIVSSDWDVWDDEVSPAQIMNYLGAIDDKDVTLYINSPGGSVFAGTQIYSMLQRHKGKINVHIDGLAASISSVIALAGDSLTMPENTFMMIHKPLFGSAGGNANELRELAVVLDRIEEGMLTAYTSRLKDPSKVDEIKQMLDAETWLTAREVEALFTNVIVTPANRAVAKVPSDVLAKQFNKLPDTVQIVDEIEEPIVATSKGDETPMTLEELKQAILDGTIKADEVKALVIGQGEVIAKADVLEVINALGEYKTPQAVAELLAKAEHGNAYMTDLIDKAKAARIKAQGEDFTPEQADRYVASLVRSGDLDYIKDEIVAFEKQAEKILNAGRQVAGEEQGGVEDDVIMSVLKEKGVN